MSGSYATSDEYRRLTGDASSDDGRVTAMLEQQSAKLRALCRIGIDDELDDDQETLARSLVVDAVRKALSSSVPSWMAQGVDGVDSASFAANGLQMSVEFANASGSAWFDQSLLKALRRSLRGGQAMGWL